MKRSKKTGRASTAAALREWVNGARQLRGGADNARVKAEARFVARGALALVDMAEDEMSRVGWELMQDDSGDDMTRWYKIGKACGVEEVSGYLRGLRLLFCIGYGYDGPELDDLREELKRAKEEGTISPAMHAINEALCE